MAIDGPRDGAAAHLVNTTGQTGVDERTEAYGDMSWLPDYQQLPPKQPFLAPPGFTGAGIPKQKFRHLDGLPEHASRCKILENWIIRLCDALNPLPGILNPIRTVFTPFALEGAQEDASQSTGAVALFHMICSASGFHLSNTSEAEDERRKFERLALEHHEMGICYLRENIRTDDESQYAPILASLIICLLTEDITVNESFWRIHIRGAVEWVNHVGVEYWYQTESASMIYQMFLCMGTLVQSQILPGDRSGYGWDLRFNLESHPGPYLIESFFGLPKPILEAIHSMNDIQKRAQEQHHPENSPADHGFSAELLKEIDALEFELLLMMPSPWESPISIPQGKQLIYHYGYTYYYASLLYLKRTLKGVPIREVQGLVKKALQHIEALKTLEAGHSTPCLWPIAIIAFETHNPELRPRMLACIDFFSKQSTLLMWEKFGSSVRSLWTRRQSPGEENLSWHAYSPIFYHNYVFI
uniref:Transcription factor domain-containing protein n=1 Tax=Bionectria ochroleuca TaxID=29856 RepID=A0A8H7N1C8_BIOOC